LRLQGTEEKDREGKEVIFIQESLQGWRIKSSPVFFMPGALL
jgi:hypothetical protein